MTTFSKMVPNMRVVSINFRLTFGIEADDLGVAAAFKVEDAVVAPAMLVVTNQSALGVIAEGGFACAAQTEEKGHVICILAVIGAAVHGQNAAAGHIEVHSCENAFLNLAAVLAAADDDQSFAKINQNESLAVGAVKLRFSVETRHIDDGEFRDMTGQFFRVKLADEHIAGKKIMPGVFGDDAHFHLVARIGADIGIEDEDIAVLNVGA